MALVRFVLFLLRAQVALATNFSAAEGAPFNPDPNLGCLHRPLNDARDVVVASKVLPCGTKLLLYSPRTRRHTLAVVQEWGPLHADMDLAPVVRRRLRHNGYERILFWRIPVGGVPNS